jgi:hypothetical protein
MYTICLLCGVDTEETKTANIPAIVLYCKANRFKYTGTYPGNRDDLKIFRCYQTNEQQLINNLILITLICIIIFPYKQCHNMYTLYILLTIEEIVFLYLHLITISGSISSAQ